MKVYKKCEKCDGAGSTHVMMVEMIAKIMLVLLIFICACKIDIAKDGICSGCIDYVMGAVEKCKSYGFGYEVIGYGCEYTVKCIKND